MTSDRHDRNMADAARGYHEPPPTPRDRMWERIDAARNEERRQIPTTAPLWWRRRQVLWPAAVVAALAIGLTVGRSLNPAAPSQQIQPSVIAHDGRPPADPDTMVSTFTGNLATYRQAARPVLARSEMLLLQLRTGAQSPSASESYSHRAVGLLAQTRLLLGSPAADDPELAPLLEDLELALARLVHVTSGPAAAANPDGQLQALEEGLDRKAVLPRLRDQLNAGTAPVGL